ncbi:MAG: chromosome segregation protein SMC, partial [Nitrospiraceae bacterium]
RYKKLFEEIKDIDVRKAKRDVLAFLGGIAGLMAKEEALKLREAEASAQVNAQEAVIEEKKRSCVDMEKSLDEIRLRLYALEKEATEDEGKIALLRRDCENLMERFDDLTRQDRHLDGEKETASVSIREVKAAEQEMRQALVNLEKLLAERNEAFTAADSDITSLESSLEEKRKTLFSRAEDISTIRNEISHLNLNIANLDRKTEKISHDISSLSGSLLTLASTLEQVRGEMSATESGLREMVSTREEFTLQLRDKKSELAERGETLNRQREELAAMTSKLESLKEMDLAQLNLFDESIRTLCQVADIFDTPPEYEAAIEAVLGDKLAASVVDSHGEIIRALERIREHNARRIGFITPGAAQHVTAASAGVSASGAGVIGEAMKFVSVREGFENVAASLLKDVLLVDTLSTAFSFWKASAESGEKPCFFVTLDGEVLEPSGMVFGGRDRGVLKIKRLIKELDTSLSGKREEISLLEHAVAGLKDGIVTLENEIISLDGKISGQEKYRHELEVKIANLTEEDGRLRKKHEYIEIELSDDHRQKGSLEEALREKEEQCRRLEQEKLEVEESIRNTQENISGKKEHRESLRAGLTEVRLDLTSMGEKMASLRKEIDRLNGVLRSIDQKKEDMANERASIQEIIAQKERSVVEREEALKLKILSVSEFQTEASRTNEILDARKAELELMEKHLKDLARELEGIHGEISHLEMKKMEQTMKLNYLKEDMYKAYALEIETADVPDTVTPEEEQRLPELKDKLQALGPVSLGTLDEYEELKTRFDFLSKQRDDLLNAIAALEDTIQKINRTSKKRLQEAFDALNEKFKEVFTILFGKGRAELQLTEGSILDAGIEIIAQPPGKRLQNMNLLSGGEKALTALSLLFAGFMIKPTPMCLLDEVDAPLDESNTERFITLLREMAKNIQFIAITHNRRTMEAADYMYGITMEEPGSSKVVSMHLAEAV